MQAQSEMLVLINDFIAHQPSAERAQLRRLLCENFLPRWESTRDIERAMRDSVSEMQAGKLSALQRYRRFADWLTAHGANDPAIEWPAGDPSSRFERLVAICRLMQGREVMREREAVEYLTSKLWVSERTIREDLRILREGGGDLYAHSALNQAFRIDGLSGNREPIRFLSSVHPVLLLENLTAVVLLIESLLEKAKQQMYRNTCLETANHVWSQLTDYARAKVRENIRRDFGSKPALLEQFETLEGLAQSTAFRAEQAFMETVPDRLLHYLKMGQACRIRWTDAQGQVQERIGTPIDYDRREESLIVFEAPDGACFELPESQILSVRRSESESDSGRNSN